MATSEDRIKFIAEQLDTTKWDQFFLFVMWPFISKSEVRKRAPPPFPIKRITESSQALNLIAEKEVFQTVNSPIWYELSKGQGYLTEDNRSIAIPDLRVRIKEGDKEYSVKVPTYPLDGDKEIYRVDNIEIKNQGKNSAEARYNLAGEISIKFTKLQNLYKKIATKKYDDSGNESDTTIRIIDLLLAPNKNYKILGIDLIISRDGGVIIDPNGNYADIQYNTALDRQIKKIKTVFRLDYYKHEITYDAGKEVIDPHQQNQTIKINYVASASREISNTIKYPDQKLINIVENQENDAKYEQLVTKRDNAIKTRDETNSRPSATPSEKSDAQKAVDNAEEELAKYTKAGLQKLFTELVNVPFYHYPFTSLTSEALEAPDDDFKHFAASVILGIAVDPGKWRNPAPKSDFDGLFGVNVEAITYFQRKASEQAWYDFTSVTHENGRYTFVFCGDVLDKILKGLPDSNVIFSKDLFINVHNRNKIGEPVNLYDLPISAMAYFNIINSILNENNFEQMSKGEFLQEFLAKISEFVFTPSATASVEDFQKYGIVYDPGLKYEIIQQSRDLLLPRDSFPGPIITADELDKKLKEDNKVRSAQGAMVYQINILTIDVKYPPSELKYDENYDFYPLRYTNASKIKSLHKAIWFNRVAKIPTFLLKLEAISLYELTAANGAISESPEIAPDGVRHSNYFTPVKAYQFTVIDDQYLMTSRMMQSVRPEGVGNTFFKYPHKVTITGVAEMALTLVPGKRIQILDNIDEENTFGYGGYYLVTSVTWKAAGYGTQDPDVVCVIEATQENIE